MVADPMNATIAVPAPRFAFALAAAIVFGLFALLFGVEPRAYFWLLDLWGLQPFRFPFLDSHAVLAAIECTRQGYDVYVANPCDVLTRPHVYSPLFLEAAILPVSVTWNNVAGIVLSLAFFAALATLPPPQDRRGWLVTGLATFSTMTAYAIERGNNDLVIFVLAALAGHLMLRTTWVRVVAYAVILFGAFLKFYPLALLILALREMPRAFLGLLTASLILVALFIAHYQTQLAMAMMLVPTGSYFTDFFGAVNLPRGMGVLLSPLGQIYPSLAPALPYLPWIILLALAVTCLRRAVDIAVSPERRAQFIALDAPRAIFFVIGATLIVACFFAGQNIDYRGIFFLMLLPGLAKLSSGTGIAIVFVMWSEFIRRLIERAADTLGLPQPVERSIEAALWLVRELVWWRIIATLAGLLLCYVVTSELGAALFARLPLLKRALH
jgi:hypothetical protein